MTISRLRDEQNTDVMTNPLTNSRQRDGREASHDRMNYRNLAYKRNKETYLSRLLKKHSIFYSPNFAHNSFGDSSVPTLRATPHYNCRHKIRYETRETITNTTITAESCCWTRFFFSSFFYFTLSVPHNYYSACP